MGILELMQLRESFWGLEASTQAPNPNQRACYIKEHFSRATLNNDKLVFSFAQAKDGFVCERGLYHLIGFTSERFNRQWRQIRLERLHQINPEKFGLPELPSKMEKISYPVQLEKAKAYIRSVTIFVEGDDFVSSTSLPSIGETVPHKDVSQKDAVVVPYFSVQEFYTFKYCLDMEESGDDPVSKSTFADAFSQIPEVRTLRCKGSFNTCSICNVADELSNDSTRFSRPQQKIIRDFKQCHIMQQFKERQKLEENLRYSQGFDLYGNTVAAFVYSDGMTVMAGNTPKKKGDSSNPSITNRVIGVLVVCGPIKEYLIYNLDDFASGGANTMIEITRQGN